MDRADWATCPCGSAWFRFDAVAMDGRGFVIGYQGQPVCIECGATWLRRDERFRVVSDLPESTAGPDHELQPGEPALDVIETVDSASGMPWERTLWGRLGKRKRLRRRTHEPVAS